MSLAGDEINVCVKCDKHSEKENALNLVGSAKGNREEDSKHPLDKLLEQSRTLYLETLIRKLEKTKVTNVLKNKSLPKRTLELHEEPICPKRAIPQNVSSSTRSTAESSFDFKHNCFYCTKDCVYDEKHPDHNMFENVRTTNSAIFNLTREICKQ